MLAHCAVVAEDFRAELADGEVLLSNPNTWSGWTASPSAWKRAYEDVIWSRPLARRHRTVLLVIKRLSDPMGRSWCGQTRIARDAEYSDRHLRRILVELEKSGYLRIEKQSFKSLTEAQRALGLPLPYRNDDGRAPDLLTLLVDGEAAHSFVYPMRRAASAQDKPRQDIARTAPPGEFVPGEPRSKSPEIPPDKMTDDPLGSAFLTRKVEGDPEPHPRPILVDEPKTVAAQNNSPPEPDAWREINRAYDAQYRRVYHSTPTTKCMPAEDQQVLIVHIDEMAEVFKSKMLERGIDVTALPEKPRKMLVDQALRAWLDG